MPFLLGGFLRAVRRLVVERFLVVARLRVRFAVVFRLDALALN